MYKPEYENQESFDLYVLTPSEWMVKYKAGPYTYKWKLFYEEQLTGRPVATPEIRNK